MHLFTGSLGQALVSTVGGHKLNHLAINSTTTVATEARANPALPATAVVGFVSAHGTSTHLD